MLPLAVVDLQPHPGLRRSSPFTVSQFSLVDVATLEEKFYIFRQPPKEDSALQQVVLEWGEGDNDYRLLDQIVEAATEEHKYIFTRGAEKAVFLSSKTRKPVFDIARFGCPSARKLVRDLNIECESCPEGVRTCSHVQARCLARWAYANRRMVDLEDHAARLHSYANWTSMLDPHRLSNMGFYHIPNSSNGIRCLYCGHEILSVKATTNVEAEHFEVHPECIMHERDD